MDIKRTLTALIGLPVVILILVLGNKYIIDIFLMLIAVVCTKEYYTVIEKVAHPIKWIGYASTIIIAIASIINFEKIVITVIYSIPIIILLLFLYVIITNMETTFKDVAYTFLGVFYITFFIMFLSLIMNLEKGKIFLGYTIIIAWTTDIFAYLVGRTWGKHHFSKVSPKKSVEGCIAGMIGAILVGIVYVLIVQKLGIIKIEISYVYIAIVSIALSIISQIGDFVASSIKRFADIKDYGNLLPGHGGMLDRIDSLIFIAPFVYMLVQLI